MQKWNKSSHIEWMLENFYYFFFFWVIVKVAKVHNIDPTKAVLLSTSGKRNSYIHTRKNHQHMRWRYQPMVDTLANG